MKHCELIRELLSESVNNIKGKIELILVLIRKRKNLAVFILLRMNKVVVNSLTCAGSLWRFVVNRVLRRNHLACRIKNKCVERRFFLVNGNHSVRR